MRKLLVLVLPLLLVACSSAEGERRDRARADAIDSLVHLWLAVDSTPGISIAVVHRGDTLVLRGYGNADVEQRIPATDRTVFGIASVTKQFAAAAIMKLVDEGRLRLDTPVGAVLPEYRGPGRSVTIHQLLNHTSGIPSYTRRGSPFWAVSHQDLGRDQMLPFFEHEPLEFEPGTGWAYNNSAYYLLGVILERVTGDSLAEHFATALLQPLGLEQTGVCSSREIVPDRARGYWVERGRLINAPPFEVSAHNAAGAVCSTARDMVRWARALAGSRVVSRASYERMTTPTTVYSVYRNHPYARSGSALQPYGYGLYIGQSNQRPVVAHGGDYIGFRAALAHYPDDDLTIAVLANGPAPVVALQEQIASHVLGTNGPAAER